MFIMPMLKMRVRFKALNKSDHIINPPPCARICLIKFYFELHFVFNFVFQYFSFLDAKNTRNVMN